MEAMSGDAEAGQCGKEFHVTGNLTAFYCTRSKRHVGGHEWDPRKDQFHLDNYPR